MRTTKMNKSFSSAIYASKQPSNILLAVAAGQQRLYTGRNVNFTISAANINQFATQFVNSFTN
jgi:hypothetical protein